MTKKIAILAGDGIGQEVVPQAIRVLEVVAKKFNLSFDCQNASIGGEAYDQYQTHFPVETKNLCEQSDAILFGSVGGPVTLSHLEKWKNCEANSILALRKTLQLNANLRPAVMYPELAHLCPLNRVTTSLDLLIVRELSGDIYFGEHKQTIVNGKRVASDMAEYTEDQIAAIAHTAFQAAEKRNRQLTSVDKANVLATSKLWREVVSEIASQYPTVTLEHMLVDNCAMQLIHNPTQFDVIVTGNLFGDILSDEASMIPGSLGLMPSASLNADGFGLYEPSGGSAPDIAGQDIANPIAQILSVAMMLQYSFSALSAAKAIERAVCLTLEQGLRTRDLCRGNENFVGTKEMTNTIIANI